MATSDVAHGRVVLAAVIGGGSIRALDYAWRFLTPDHFTDKSQRVLFELLRRYADQTSGGIMTRSALDDLMRGQKPGSVQMYGEAYDAIAALAVPDLFGFKHSVSQLRELAAERGTEVALAQGLEILRHGVKTGRGDEELRGHADARAYVMAQLAEAEQAGGGDDTPEGNVMTEGDDILAAYAQAKELKAAGQAPGIEFGLPDLDAYLGGLGNGEMALVAADTTAGKTSLCVQIAWYNAIECGKNVVIFTTEQLRRSLQGKIVARHSRHSKFGLPRGLNDADIRYGRLEPEEERALAAVLDDLKTCGDYGVLNVVQMPEVATVSVMAARYSVIRRQYRPDLVIADYLQLFTPDHSRRESNMREDQSGIIKSAARWCAACDDGRGVPFISPWQVNNEGVNFRKQHGRYDLQHLSETKESGRTPGMVVALLNPEEDMSGGRLVPLEVQVLKNRAGPRGRRFPVTADYATSWFSDRSDCDTGLDEMLGPE
jgi:replicative DNA helicase